MELNFPSQVRQGIYITVVLGTAIVVPLHAGGVVSDLVLNVWASLSGAASLLASLNVNHKKG